MQPIAEDADDSGWVVGNTEVRVEHRAAQGHVLFFRTVPSAITVVRWVNENAFVLEVQTRPCPTFGRVGPGNCAPSRSQNRT
jgi:hypothetical protein